MNKEQIVYKKVSDLKLNPRNPRKNDGAVDTVALSIQKYGFKNIGNVRLYCGADCTVMEKVIEKR